MKTAGCPCADTGKMSTEHALRQARGETEARTLPHLVCRAPPTLREISFKKRAGNGIRTRDESLEGSSVTATPCPHRFDLTQSRQDACFPTILASLRPLKKTMSCVGEAGFEPTTSWTQTKRATELRYSPRGWA